MNLFFKIMFLILSALILCECVFVYSSFWAPLFNPKILNYRVDADFNSDAGMKNREEFEKNYGYRGQNLIADLGTGNGPSSLYTKDQNYGDVRFYYTYQGAEQSGVQKKK